MRAPEVANVTVTIIGDIAFHGPLCADPVGLVQRMEPGMRDLLRADIVVANLECILSDSAAPRDRQFGEFPMFGPTPAAQVLRQLGVHVVSLANNHILDYGLEGLQSTWKALDAAGIAHFGAGFWDQVARPCVVERGGMRVGFMGFAGNRVATPRRPGCLPLDWSRSRRLIRQSKQECDRLVVYVHDGVEAFNYPMKATVRACHRAVDAGADLIVGTHPHTIQGIEWYEGVPIAYSVGNFLSPMLSPERYDPWRRETTMAALGLPFDKDLIARELVLRCTLGPSGATVEAIPAVLEESGLPRLPTGPEADEAQAFFRRLCDAFARPEDAVWRQRDAVEQGHWRTQRSRLSWGFVLSNLHRLRWRHLAWYLKGLLGR
jgi:poly-gamma-glutamate capsule biosynthesis protein CapA/YwtB (metallophosphatase superfamily)